MSEEKSAECHSTSSISSDSTQAMKRMVQNFFLVWIDTNIDESTADFQSSLAQLRNVVNDVTSFKQEDDAIDYLTNIRAISGFLIITDTIGAQILPLIHDIPLLDTIYILISNQQKDAKWTEQWVKVNGIHTDISSICKALQVATKQCDYDSIAVSFVSIPKEVSNINSNQLEPSFMYTQLFKEILFEMKNEENSIRVLTNYCRQFYQDNPEVIDEFAVSYRSESAIWWYTRECFLYRMLNRALRALEGDTIINMAFFIRDLHRQIQQLHSQQVKNYNEKPFIVYRGQGLSKEDFEKLMKNRDGLMSFNSFLSTTEEREISLRFAKKTRSKTDMTAILFQITITPSLSSTPFASIRQESYYNAEEEILFSMHSVFRITNITKIDIHHSLYQVDLKLTEDDDQELRTLTSRIRKEIPGASEWGRLGHLLIKLNQLDKAEEIYTHLQQQSYNQDQRAIYYHQLGRIRSDRADYEKAIEYYTEAFNIQQKTLPANHPDLATSYNNMAGVYYHMGEYSKALSFYEKALEIQQKTLPANHHSLATSYNNMAEVYKDMGEYSKALSFHEKALEIQQKTLPANHPDLATSYNNMAGVYKHMGVYSKALSFHEKALEIQQKTLPANHPDLATSYNNMAGVYKHMGVYSKALSFHEKALEIQQKTLPANHPDLATSYNNMAGVYKHMGEYSKALSFHEKALEIQQKTLPANHPDLATSYNNMAGVYEDMGEYSKALSFYEKALEIRQKTLPANHPDLATSYNNMAEVYKDMGEYSKALSFHEKALEIRQKTLAANHPSLATSYNNMAEVYKDMGEYSKALSFHEKALEMLRKTLPANHPSLASSYNNMAGVYEDMGEYSKALSFYEKALEIQQKTLPANRPDLATSYNNMAGVYYHMGEYSKALSFYEKALEIQQKTLPANHPDLATSYNNMAGLYYHMGDSMKSLSFYERARNISHISLPLNHPNLKQIQKNIEIVKRNL